VHRHISLWVHEDAGGGNDPASGRSAPVDRPTDRRPAPFCHFSITAARRRGTIIAGARPLGALMKSHCETDCGRAKEMDDDDGERN